MHDDRPNRKTPCSTDHTGRLCHRQIRLGDEITLTEIFHEVGVIYRSISTVCYLLAWRTWLGCDEVTKNCKVIGDKIVNGYPCNRGRRRGGDDEINRIQSVVRRVGDFLSHVGI